MPDGPVVPKALDHSGFIVSDIERSIAFYVDMFGAKLGVRADVAGDVPARMQGADKDEVDFQLAYLDFGNSSLELISYRSPDMLPLAPVYQLGAGHLGLIYDDVGAAYTALKERGMEFFSEPMHIDEGPCAGWVVVYGTDPDGNRIELLST